MPSLSAFNWLLMENIGNLQFSSLGFQTSLEIYLFFMKIDNWKVFFFFFMKELFDNN